MQIRILSESDCRAAVDMAAAIDIQAEAFELLARDRSIEGLRSFAVSKEPPGAIIFNPSVLTQGAGFGVKVVCDFYGNDDRGVPRMNALVALFDGETGQPRTVMEAGYLTDLRTGAGTGLAARYLARPDSKTVAIIGAGRVARNQIEALVEVCPIEKIWLSTRSEARARDFLERMAKIGGKVPSNILVVESREAAVREADIVIAATTAKQPTFPGEALKAGTFIAAAGAYEATSREVDSETIRRASKWVIDSRTDCLDEAGDLQIPISEGIISRDQVAQIAELVAGERPGREAADEITYYKSIGVPIQDLVTAQHIERRAVDLGLGTVIDIGGDND
jgi:ornithine cyclodeaminase